MKIIRLKINNVLNLRAIDVRPDPNVNKVSGKNAAGKSNLLETIRFSLLGKRAMPKKPLKEGTKKGDIVVELDDYIVNVSITPAGEYWNVTDKKGLPVSSPQTLLKELVGPISFDPLALLDDDQKKLRAVLLQLVGVDLDAFDTKIKALRDERTIVGRSLKNSKILLESCTYHDDAPKQEVSVGDMATELQKANESNNEITKAGTLIDEVRKKIANLEADLKTARELVADGIEFLQNHTIIDPTDINTKIVMADVTNKKVRDNAEFTLREKAADKEKDDYDTLTDDIEQVEHEKNEALAAAKMPIPGLGVDDDGVVYNGIPLAQVNKAKRIEIGTAIHMALNPKLRVMFVDANAFDEETEAAIEAAVKDKDYQLFEEVVDDDSETGIHLVDGTIEK
ncbi:MAG: AAA family ATPase [Candidatus Atribacteria bacterium]|nr:AAA family ATPase [Candidatus Atribacteria bacterium]MBE3145035.1 AAA family ATPase [Planctomycetota bacterium]